MSNILCATTQIVCLWLCHKKETILVENFDVFEFSSARIEGWDDVTFENFQWQRFMLNLLDQDYFDSNAQKLCIRLSCSESEMKNLLMLSKSDFKFVPKDVKIKQVSPNYFTQLDDLLAEVLM